MVWPEPSFSSDELKVGVSRDWTTDRVVVLQTEKESCHGSELQRRGRGWVLADV